MISTFDMSRATLYRFSRGRQSRTLLIWYKIQIINGRVSIFSGAFDGLENDPIVNTTSQSLNFNLSSIPGILNLGWVIEPPYIFTASSFIQNLNFEFLNRSVAVLHKSHLLCFYIQRKRQFVCLNTL